LESTETQLRIRTVLILIAFASLTAGIQASGQVRPQYESSVTLKLIQIYVVDKARSPVRNLTKEDFELFDNSQRISITEFESHDLVTERGGVGLPVDATTPSSLRSESPVQNRKFIILFDFAYNTARGIASSVKVARSFLDTETRQGDEIAFLSYSMLRGLRIHEFFTADHAKIKTALSAITAKDIAGRADEIEQAYWMVVGPNAGERTEVSLEEQVQHATLESQRRDSMQQAARYLGDLEALAQALRLVEGQKSVLFFSTGVPSSLVNVTRHAGVDKQILPGGTAFQTMTGSVFQIGDSVLRSLLEGMLKAFSASDCSFYAFDTRESSKIASLFAYDELAFMNRPTGGLLGSDNTGVFRDEKTTGMDTLRRVSRQTGGEYYSNIALYVRNLKEISDLTGCYYVLGYPISPVADGRFHDVKVEVKRKACRVRTQPGWFNPKPFSAYSEIEKNIHLFDLALRERSELSGAKDLAISALSYDAGQGPEVRTLTRMPRELWRELGGRQAELVALFFGSSGDLISLQRSVVSPTEYRDRDVLFTTSIRTAPGPVDCRTIVRDLESGQSALASTRIHVPASRRPGLSICSPLLLGQGGGSFLLEGTVRGSDSRRPWNEAYPFDPALISPILGGETVRSSKVSLLVPCRISGENVPNIVMSANLVDAQTGKSSPLAIELRGSSRNGDLEVLRLEASLEGVASGSYQLYVHVGDKVSGEQGSSSVPLTVER
jgi:VWFA-related protein